MDAEGLLQMGLTAAAGIVLLYSIARGAPQQAPTKEQQPASETQTPSSVSNTVEHVQNESHKAKAQATPQRAHQEANDSTIAREMHVPDETPSWMSRHEASFVKEFAEQDLHPTWMGASKDQAPHAAEYEPSWLSHREPSFVGNPFEAEMLPSWMSKQGPATAAPTPIRKSDAQHSNGHHHEELPVLDSSDKRQLKSSFVVDEKEQEDDEEHGAIEASWMSTREAQVVPGREAEFSWMTRKDPVPSTKQPAAAYRVPTRSHAEYRVVVSTNDVVSHVARDHSDMVFVYPVASSGFLGETLKAEAKAHPKCAIQLVETRAGAGRVVVGAAASHKQRVSVLCSSRSLRPMIPAILDLAEKHLAVTFHVALSAISDEDVSSKVDHSDLAAIRDIEGATIFFSAGPQDTYETAVAAHWTAAQLSGPVFHIFDSTGRLNRIADIELSLKNKEAPHHHAHSEDAGRAAAKVLRSVKKAPFEYTGNAHARVVLIGMGAAAQVAERHVSSHRGAATGAIKVRMLRPWSGEELLRAVPNSALRVCVLDQSNSDALFSIVAATFAADASRRHVQVSYVRVPPSFRGVTYDLVSRALEELLLSNDERLVLAAPGKKTIDSKAKASVKSLCVFVSAKHAHGAFVAGKEAAVHAHKDHVRFSSYTDDFAGESGGVSLMELRLGAGPELSHIEGPLDASEAQVVVVADEDVLTASSQIDLFGPLCEGGIFIVPAKASLSLALKRRASAKHAHIVHLSGDAAHALEGWASVVAGLAALSKADLDHVLTPVLSAFRAGHHDSMDWTLLNDACRRLEREAETVAHRVSSLHAGAQQNGHDSHQNNHAHANGNGHFPRRLGDLFTNTGDSASFLNGGGVNADASQLSDVVSATSYSPVAVDSSVFGLIPRASFKKHHHVHNPAEESVLEVVRPHEVAWNVVFKEAYETGAALRPREHETHKVRLVCRKRLTPLTYERNIFHLEFDISGTDLKYEIGDALGVFGHNDEKEVDDFIAHYNATGGSIDPDAFIAFKNTETKAGKAELVSVRNLLLQHLDLFGRPSKKFYVWLAEHAKSRYEKLKLNHTGTDDAEAFKLSVNETLTFADILLQHPSARPSVEQLASVIPAIKARHYSIASSMRYTPRSVALLVVAVDWKTPSGRVRYGQCTRYLATLNPEQEGGCFVTVDVVPSVLRLPPRPEQPIVMAGLGTGMAPFRAFVQERKVQKESGLKVGPIVLYFGARHRSEEWLYGEEWDQYHREGLVTRLGLAFSRDQKEKIYIQHRIKEDAALLKDLFMDQEGYFYLCGPTWPVPDVRDAVAMGLDPENAKKGITDVVERLKDEGRYILEVY